MNERKAMLLTDEQKGKLKEMYSKHVSNWYDNIDEDLYAWKIYSNKIKSKDGLSLDEYTNTKKVETGLPSGYFCNFIENGALSIAVAKPGFAKNYMVRYKENRDDKIWYYIKENDSVVEKKEAEKKYNADIMPLLRKLVEEDDISELIKIEKDDKYEAYAAKQILQKIAVLSNLEKEKTDFIWIYKKENINLLYKLFCGESGTDNEFLKKMNEIAVAAKEIFFTENSSNIDLRTWQKVCSFLWDLSDAGEMATEESPNVIFYGPPGTGKTYTVKRNIDFLTLAKKEVKSCFVQFHPSFTYEDFIDGLKPIGVSGGNMQFEFVNGYFKDFCIKARNAMENAIKEKKEIPIYYFVVDEINRANLSTVFGETLSLIEADYRDKQEDIIEREKLGDKNEKEICCGHLITTQNCKILETMINNAEGAEKEKLKKLAYYYKEKAEDGKKVQFGIPSNIRFIGMMNDVDKSIDSFDLALRRRFEWRQEKCNYKLIEHYFSDLDKNFDFDCADYAKSCENLNNYISSDLGLGSSYEFGHSFFMKLAKAKTKDGLFKNYLEPTLREYLRAFFDESEIENKLKEAKEKFILESKNNSKEEILEKDAGTN